MSVPYGTTEGPAILLLKIPPVRNQLHVADTSLLNIALFEALELLTATNPFSSTGWATIEPVTCLG